MKSYYNSKTIFLGDSNNLPLKVLVKTYVAPKGNFDQIVNELDSVLGIALASNYEYPSRYSIWNLGFSNPLLMFETHDRDFKIRAFSERGWGILSYVRDVLHAEHAITITEIEKMFFSGVVDSQDSGEIFAEEERTRRVSIFTVVRALWKAFQHPELENLGFYGAFGYDLIFNFENIEKILPRSPNQRDIVLFLPDRIHKSVTGNDLGVVTEFEFQYGDHITSHYPRVCCHAPYVQSKTTLTSIKCDHAPGEYEAVVELAKHEFCQGNLFEAVPGQSFSCPINRKPSEVFQQLVRNNPSPFAFLINLDDGEFLIGASPEMYLRCSGQTVETCPISGTIARGSNPLEDADQVLALLSSKKDEAELTMCTDVDRNDKSRICLPGSIQVKGRRQIEFYSGLIHTVDHVVAKLAEGFDGLDAFISHMWAVTVTGAPKISAIRFLEKNEKSPRRWYAGAIGGLCSDGSVNTALSIRMVQVKDGIATVRAGSTTLYYSDPAAEERETRIKASAFLTALKGDGENIAPVSNKEKDEYRKRNFNIMMVDHEDSFVNTLANYFRSYEPRLRTYRPKAARRMLDRDTDLVILSPGPGKPADFITDILIHQAIELEVPIFGICLGLQAVVEYFGGKLGILSKPCHGIATKVSHSGNGIFKRLPQNFDAARYHSLYAIERELPESLTITARSTDGVIMGVSHKILPIHTIQFHPESIITSKENIGMRLIRNMLEQLSNRG